MNLLNGNILPYLKNGNAQSSASESEPALVIYYGSTQITSAHIVISGVLTEVTPSYVNP